MKNKVLVIGLDGADFNFIKPLIKQNRLPNLKKLIENGFHAKLKTIFPAVTPPAWTSMVTGKNPAKHGIFDFTEDQAVNNYPKIVNSQNNQAKTLWEMLNENKLNTIIINVPFITYPPESIEGIMISGDGAPSTDVQFTYPRGLGQKLIRQGFNFKFHTHSSNKDDIIKEETQRFENILKLSKYIMKNNDWDFFFTVFTSTDSLIHCFADCIDKNHPFYTKEKQEKYGEVINSFYEKCDRAIGDLMKIAGESTVFVVSDHGTGSCYKKLLLNNWLIEKGFMKLKEKKKGLLLKLGITKKNIYNLLHLLHLEKIKDKIPLTVRKQVPDEKTRFWDVDWDQTKAYFSGYWGRLYINKKIVVGDDYNKIIKQITKELLMLEGKNKEKIVKKVILANELYSGPYIEKAPDLTVELNNPNYLIIGDFGKGEIFQKDPIAVGTHRQHGIFIANGSDISNGIKLNEINMVDIVPIILSSFNLSLPDDLDGKNYNEIFKEHKTTTFTKAKEFKKEKKNVQMSKSDEEQIKERLRNLGYL